MAVGDHRDSIDLNFSIQFISLAGEHFSLIYAWFNEPHVQEFYSLRSWTLEEVSDKLTPYLENWRGIHSFIVSVGNQNIGYVQKYALNDSQSPEYELNSELLATGSGIDFFIGDKNFLKRGFSQIIVGNFLQKEIAPYYRECLVDPDVRNSASIRLFERCGFVKTNRIKSKDALGRPVELQILTLAFP